MGVLLTVKSISDLGHSTAWMCHCVCCEVSETCDSFMYHNVSKVSIKFSYKLLARHGDFWTL
jgi:hypothetical protein